MCIIGGSKVYNGQHQYVSGHLQTHLGQENGQPGKKEGGSTCKAFAYKDPLLIELLPNVGLYLCLRHPYSVQDVYPFPTMKMKS